MRVKIVALSLLFLGGACGGGGGGKPSSNPVVFSVTRTFDEAGGVIEDKARGIKLVIAPAALVKATSVTLEVRASQRINVTPTNWSSNPNAIDVSLEPSYMPTIGIRVVPTERISVSSTST